MGLLRLISRYEDAKFAIRLYALPETSGMFELLVTDEAPLGYLQGRIEVPSISLLPRQLLAKGAIQSIENLVLQSGVLDLPEQEPQEPLLIDGMEFMMMDGIHYKIETYWQGKHKVVKRFNWCEPTYATLFNAVVLIALKDSPLLDQALKFKCMSM